MVPYLATKKLFTNLSAVFVPEGKEPAGVQRQRLMKSSVDPPGTGRVTQATGGPT